jgi:hypothetical protein
MASYLTSDDEKNFGPELLDVAIRAAQHAVAPELQRLHDENAQLQDQLNSATKMALDRELDAAVPNWREINNDPRFHAWLLLPEPYSGVIRDRLLKDAAQAANAQRVISIFRGFLREVGAAGQAPASPASQRTSRAPSGQRIYDRSEIVRMWERRRRAKLMTRLGSGGNTNCVGLQRRGESVGLWMRTAFRGRANGPPSRVHPRSSAKALLGFPVSTE